MTVSYCITLYNKARYIEGVLRSVLAERDATGGEVVIYDDGSTDESVAIAERVGGASIMLGGCNRGVYAATNAVLSRASQPFIRLVDADDVLVPGSTGHMLDLQRRHGAALVHGRLGSIAAPPGLGAFARAQERVDAAPMRAMLRNMPYNLSAALMPADLVKAVSPLPESYRTSQDLYLALRLAKRGPFVDVPAVACLVPVETDNRLSRRMAETFGDTCRIMAAELASGVGRGDAAFAVRRHAARCVKYFEREAPGVLSWPERLFLLACHLAIAAEPVSRQIARLGRISGFYARDAGRVLS